jgi:hypothetical protein
MLSLRTLFLALFVTCTTYASGDSVLLHFNQVALCGFPANMSSCTVEYVPEFGTVLVQDKIPNEFPNTLTGRNAGPFGVRYTVTTPNNIGRGMITADTTTHVRNSLVIDGVSYQVSHDGTYDYLPPFGSEFFQFSITTPLGYFNGHFLPTWQHTFQFDLFTDGAELTLSDVLGVTPSGPFFSLDYAGQPFTQVSFATVQPLDVGDSRVGYLFYGATLPEPSSILLMFPAVVAIQRLVRRRRN